MRRNLNLLPLWTYWISSTFGFPPVPFKGRAERFCNSPYLLPFSFSIRQRDWIFINKHKHVSMNSWTLALSLLAEKTKRHKPGPTYILSTHQYKGHHMERESSENCFPFTALGSALGLCWGTSYQSCPEHYEQPFLLLGRLLLTHLVPLVCSQIPVFLYTALMSSHCISTCFWWKLQFASHFKRGQRKSKHSTHMNKKNTHRCKVGVNFQGQSVDD